MQYVQSFFAAHWAIYALLIAMVADVLTGLFRAARDRALTSNVSMAGMTKKAGMLTLVGLLILLQPGMRGLPLGDTVAMFYFATEFISIIENLGKLNVFVPQSLRRYFEKLVEDETPETPDLGFDEQLAALNAMLEQLREKGR